jgi:hypothetical protein
MIYFALVLGIAVGAIASLGLLKMYNHDVCRFQHKILVDVDHMALDVEQAALFRAYARSIGRDQPLAGDEMKLIQSWPREDQVEVVDEDTQVDRRLTPDSPSPI